MIKNLLLTPLIFLLYNLTVYGQSGLVLPKENYVFDTTTVYFEWNKSLNSTNYNLQISTDPSFNSTVLNITLLTATNYTASGLSTNTKFYWRCKSNNSSWSNSRTFRIVNLNGFSQLKMWLKADSVQTVSGNRVSSWMDLSGNTNNYSQSNSSNQPYLLTNSNELNNHWLVEFNSTEQTFFNAIDFSSFNEGEIFSLIKLKNAPPASQSSSGIWSFGTSSSQDHYPYNNNVVYSGFGRTTRFGVGNISNLINLEKPHILNISTGVAFDFRINNVNLFTSNNGTPSFNNNVYLGKSLANHYLDGVIGEVILFNNVLTDSLRNLTYEYLRHKYAPPINLGPNISKYGFCDTTLYAGDRFESYLWSNGSTSDSLVVFSQGSYWVEVEDIFGFISRDSVQVLSSIQYPTTQLYCQNDSITWNTNLGQHYSYLWSDGSTGDTLIIASPGDYHVTVTDTNGCIFKSDTLTFSEDPFSTTASLGPDINICSGNDLGLTAGANNTTNYLWNTGETTPQITINTTGTYSVIIQNANGCEVKDTIDITILGDAPTINTQLPTTICVNETFNYQDLSTTTDGSTIIGWEWDFNDGTTAAIDQGSHSYPTGGMYSIDLEVETSAGCFNQETFLLEVKENPMLTFAISNQCENESIDFNGGQISPQTITNWEWNFDDPASGIDNSANGQNVAHTYSAYGDYDVMLIGTDIFGCVDTLIQTKTVEPTPVADFTFTEVCEGNIVSYQNTSTVANPAVISNNQWSFGDGTNSNQSNPQKPYTSHGIYTVELIITADNGCNNSISKDIKIHATPQVGFLINQDCAGIETSFTDDSFVPDGSVAQVEWMFNNQNPLNGFSITNNFANSGVYALEQTVSSGFGCENIKTSSVTINPYLNADFTFTPSAFIVGYPMAFESTGSGENEYLWSFGSFATSQQADTSIVFDESQIGTEQMVQLKVKNQWDCSDSTSVKLPVLTQRTDLEISQLFSQEINGFLTIGVRIKNLGSTPITEIDLVLSSPSTGFIKETWSGMLQADENEIYIYSANPSAKISAEDTLQNFLCIDGSIVQPAQFTEENFNNNEVCKSMTDNQTVLIQPYPNPVKNELTIKVIMPEKGVIALSVYDNRGKLVYMITEKQELEKGMNIFVIETSAWSSGKYSIVFEGEGQVPAVGFVKI